MKEIVGNLWDLRDKNCYNRYDAAIVIPTNGSRNRSGEAVMGKGLAYDAKKTFPKLPLLLGERLRFYGNIPHVFAYLRLITFPTKHLWYENGSLQLIEKSLELLVSCVKLSGYKRIYLPRLGCGNGNRNWENEIRPIMIKCLGTNNVFVVVHIKP